MLSTTHMHDMHHLTHTLLRVDRGSSVFSAGRGVAGPDLTTVRGIGAPTRGRRMVIVSIFGGLNGRCFRM